ERSPVRLQLRGRVIVRCGTDRVDRRQAVEEKLRRLALEQCIRLKELDRLRSEYQDDRHLREIRVPARRQVREVAADGFHLFPVRFAFAGARAFDEWGA